MILIGIALCTHYTYKYYYTQIHNTLIILEALSHIIHKIIYIGIVEIYKYYNNEHNIVNTHR